MAFNLDDFRNQLTGGGARPTLFEMRLNFPTQVESDDASFKSPFMVKVAAIPASTMGSIDVPYFGRKLKVAGDRTFGTLSTTIINDENFTIRRALERWMDQMAGHRDARMQFPGRNTSNSYTTNLELVQLGRQGESLRTYNFIGAFPTELAEIALSWETSDSIEDYTCTWTYQWWEVQGDIPTRDNVSIKVDANFRA